MPKHLILCDCLGSQTIDAEALGRATGLTCSRVHTALCTREIAAAAKAIETGDVVIACGQEAARFAELAVDLGQPEPLCVDIRDRAGWSDDTPAAPKMAALVAEALVPAPQAKSVDVISDGTCLIIGRGSVAFPAAERLANTLAVTVLLTEDEELPTSRDFEIVRGTLKSATGTLGNFALHLDSPPRLYLAERI